MGVSLYSEPSVTHHLVVLTSEHLNNILRGQKTVECRLSRTKRPPYGVLTAGDVLWLKQSGGPIRATTTARHVQFVHPFAKAELKYISHGYGEALQVDRTFFDNRHQSRYATLIRLGRVRRVEPFSVEKNDRNAWVVLSGPPVPSL